MEYGDPHLRSPQPNDGSRSDGSPPNFDKLDGWTSRADRSKAELGNGWTEGVHPDDRQECFAKFNETLDRQQPFRMEYRLRRHDGEYRWILNIGVPRVNPDGSLAGYIGSCVDVTERKSAEEALRTVSGRLICPSLNLI